jgi:hypothetical protein
VALPGAPRAAEQATVPAPEARMFQYLTASEARFLDAAYASAREGRAVTTTIDW